MDNSVSLYEEVADVTRRMLHAAQAEDWDTLTDLEHHSAAIVERIKVVSVNEKLSPEGVKRKIKTIQRILEDDKQIRDIVSPWMMKLKTMLQSAHMETKLNRSYGQ